MKKLLFTAFLVISLACAFALSISAATTTIDADDLDDLKAAVSAAQEKDTVIANLTGDIIIPSTSDALKIEKEMTLVINFNGYLIYAKSGSSGAGTVYGILVNHNSAKLILNGTWDVDPFNYIEPNDQKITLSSGEIVNPNKDAGVKSPDFVADGPAVVVWTGSLELNDMYMREYNTGEWAILFRSANTVEHVHNVKVDNSIIRVPDNSGYYAIDRRHGNGTLIQSTTQIEDSVFYGISGTGNNDMISFDKDSYMKDSFVLKSGIRIDSYLEQNKTKTPVEIRNVTFSGDVSLYTGAVPINLIDCTIAKETYTITISGDRHGTAKLYITTSPTCDMAGKQVYVEAAQGVTKTFKSMSELETIIEEYAIQNPAKGHTILEAIGGVKYDNYFANGMKIGNCTVCLAEGVNEKNGTANPLIESLGYSYTYDSGKYAITQGFKIDKTMLPCLNEEIEYGMIAYVNTTNVAVSPKGELNALSIKLTSEYDTFNIKVIGIPAGSEDINVVFCAYVLSNKKVYYLDNGQTSESLVGQSVNSLKQILGEEDE